MAFLACVYVKGWSLLLNVVNFQSDKNRDAHQYKKVKCFCDRPGCGPEGG